VNGNIRMSSGLTEMRVRRLDDAPGPRWARVVLDDATDPATSMTIALPATHAVSLRRALTRRAPTDVRHQFFARPVPPRGRQRRVEAAARRIASVLAGIAEGLRRAREDDRERDPAWRRVGVRRDGRRWRRR
jgi:hypothetical protein